MTKHGAEKEELFFFFFITCDVIAGDEEDNRTGFDRKGIHICTCVV